MSEVIVTSHVMECERAMQDAIDTALEMCGLHAEGYATDMCPVDTGRLKNSITHRQIDDKTEAISTDVEYAAYVELGTQKMDPRPYLKPAVENHKEEYKILFERALRG